jgi:type I restriction-modification system DNA methylase subunit/predicted type IV restriction endonuclease
MSAPDRIKKLTETFADNLESYKRGIYNETQTRREFIDPFFEELGWDISNRQGYAEAYKDVIHEDAIKVGGVTKAPDYCFRIGGARKFFLEAKKLSVNLEGDVHPAYQLRRYGWSAKLPLSILTDFEEFAVYDCRVKPVKTDKVSHARILYLTYTDFVERWEEIAGIFSRDAILKGSFDKYVESNKIKKGTTEVDAAFLMEIERWRELLARNIALRNPVLSQRELNFAVQQTIDRIVFLRIGEDRGMEPYGALMALKNGENVYRRLFQLFDKADEKYNSGLFHFRREKDRDDCDTLTPSLAIDDKPLKDIFSNLYYPESPYEFSVLPADILGQIYERFLGKVIRLTAGHQAKIEEKPEVRKAGGVYYTPGYIVEYIVKNTVGKLVEGKKPGPRGGVSHIRILDPACGSGSFLIGAYQFLLDWHRDAYISDGPENWAKGKAPCLYQSPRGEWRLTAAERKRILLNNIYGVDIDHQAVEVTKLSLLLKVLEGEDEESIGRQMSLFQERALPDLSRNIQCGNSLIGPDFYGGGQQNLFDEEEAFRVNAFDWNAAFTDVMNEGGFDAVIGNPPYVLLSKDIYSATVLDYLGAYEVAQYKTDLFHIFIQRGVTLLKQGGFFGYIVPNPWLTLKFTEKLRRYILKECKIKEIIIFNHLVFQSANVYTALIFFERGKAHQTHQIAVKTVAEALDVRTIIDTETAYTSQSSWEQNDGAQFEIRLVGDIGKLVLKIINRWKPLSQVARASLGCQAYNSSKHTQEQIKNRVFHSQTKAGEEYLPELAGKDVGRYFIKRQRGEWIKYGPWLHDYRTLDWLQGPRLLIREIPGRPPYRIQSCYVEESYCNYKTILNVNLNLSP